MKKIRILKRNLTLLNFKLTIYLYQRTFAFKLLVYCIINFCIERFIWRT